QTAETDIAASRKGTTASKGGQASRPYVFSALDAFPSPPAEGGEGWGEEGRLACACAGVSAVGCPSPRPSPRSFLTGRGSAVRALNSYRCKKLSTSLARLLRMEFMTSPLFRVPHPTASSSFAGTIRRPF